LLQCLSEAEREEAAAAKTVMAAAAMETMVANDIDGSGGSGIEWQSRRQ
jgi:hypothetical protein